MRPDLRVDARHPQWEPLSIILVCACAVAPWNAVLIAGQQPIDLLLGAAVGIAIFILLANPEMPVGRIPGWMTIGVCSVIVIVMVNAITNNSFVELSEGGRWLVAALVLPWLAVLAGRRNPGLVESLAKAFAVGTALSAAVAVSDFFGVTSLNYSLTGVLVNSNGRESGLTTHPNNVGLACAMAVPIALYFAERSRLWLAVIAVLAGGEIVSGSRAGQVSFALAIIAMLSGPLRRSTRARRRVLVSLGAILILVLVSPTVRDQFAPVIRIFNRSSTSQSNLAREDRARVAFEAFKESPLFGRGMTQATGGHQMQLQLLATGGIVLLLGFLVYLVGAARDGLRWSKSGGGNLAAAVTVAHLAWLATALFSNAIVDRFLYVPASIIAVAVTGRRHPAPTSSAAARLDGNRLNKLSGSVRGSRRVAGPVVVHRPAIEKFSN
jgi:O-antigen ligase